MTPTRIDGLDPEEQDWLDAYLDGTIEPDQFEALQDRLLESPALRAAMRRYLALDNALQEVSGELPAESETAAAPWQAMTDPVPTKNVVAFPRGAMLAAAAALALFVGWSIVSRPPAAPSGSAAAPQAERVEPSAQGFAAIGKLYHVEWSSDGTAHREGDTLGAESLVIASGTAEIQFYSGATMTVAGPAELSIKSAWEAICHEGTVRVQVPPAARGFKVHAPSTEIIDLGTEFGLSVQDGKGHVEVFSGEIAIRHRDGEQTNIKEGVALELAPDRPATPVATGLIAYPDVQRFGVQATEERRSSYAKWEAHRDQLAADRRVLAYYTFDRASEHMVRNLALPAAGERDGAVILAEPVDGRWPAMKSALEFRRPGSRVRVNIPGEFPAFTFLCWVRIDSLDRWYNALFMGDGYENGEPHWQIRDDGTLMLSIMVDDQRRHPKYPDKSRYHHVYYSPPIWDLSMSGQWVHLASTYDPATRVVAHYLNGQPISSEAIDTDFLVKTLRIGNAEIGNWGQPFREDPEFRIRNLNGRMDELAIFREALDEGEISALYERSRSGRR